MSDKREVPIVLGRNAARITDALETMKEVKGEKYARIVLALSSGANLMRCLVEVEKISPVALEQTEHLFTFLVSALHDAYGLPGNMAAEVADAQTINKLAQDDARDAARGGARR